jgi:hypothetical protein
MKYNLFLDDFRSPMDAFKYTHNTLYNNLRWVVVRSYDEFIQEITNKFDEDGAFPELISFDHDLADEHYAPTMYEGPDAYNRNYSRFKEKTGYECAKWLVDFCIDHKLKLPDYLVHSMNPVGKQNIIGYLSGYEKNQ